MPLFVCDCCGCVENTALGRFKQMMDDKDVEPSLCSKCLTGKWHGKFEYELCTRELFEEIGERNFIYWMLS